MAKLINWAGPAGVAVLWAGIVTSIITADLGLLSNTPLSDLGINPKTAPIFSISLIVSAVFFSVFGYQAWKRYRLPKEFIIIFLLAQLCQIATALVPYGGKFKVTHTLVAMTLAAMIPIFMYIFARSKNLGTLTMFSFGIAVAEIIGYVVGMSVFLFLHHGYPLSQIIIALAYHIWIVVVSLNMNKAGPL